MTKVQETSRIGRLERPALAGVLTREVINFSSYWRATTFSSTVEPTIYLLAFGFGFGSLVSEVAGYDYVEFVGTGTVATAVLFSSVFPAMFGTFIKYQFQRTYDAILAAPVDTEELVTAESLWIATRAGTFGCTPLLVAMVFGLDPRWGWAILAPESVGTCEMKRSSATSRDARTVATASRGARSCRRSGPHGTFLNSRRRGSQTSTIFSTRRA